MGKSKPKSFRINLLSETQEYYPGSYIQGNVFLELSKDMIPLKAIKIQFYGIESLNYHNGHIKERKDICRLSWAIWRNEASSQQQAAFSTGLSAGQYEFPFKVQIPADQVLPSSFEGPYGVIQYSVIAGIVRSKETKLEHTTTKPIISVKEIVNANVPRLMEPASNRAVRRMQTPKHDGGSIFLSVKIDRHGYCPGESISINVKVENQSTTQVNAIHASLVQKANYIVTLFEPGCYYGYGGSHMKRGYHKYRTSSLRIIQKIESPGIPPGKIIHWNNELFPIPAVPPTTVGDRMIMLSYVLDVSAVIHKAGSLTLQFPVTIATTLFGQPSGPSTE